MKMKIENLDPTGVVVESEEFELPLIIEETPESGYCKVKQPDGSYAVYEPMRKNRYFFHLCGHIYSFNQRTGELSLYKNRDD